MLSPTSRLGKIQMLKPSTRSVATQTASAPRVREEEEREEEEEKEEEEGGRGGRRKKRCIGRGIKRRKAEEA